MIKFVLKESLGHQAYMIAVFCSKSK